MTSNQKTILVILIITIIATITSTLRVDSVNILDVCQNVVKPNQNQKINK
ncbi:hypothetical protein [Mycoplasma sp. P36-A1]